MNKCLSCDNQCEVTSVFCQSCQALLLNRHKQREMSFQASLSPVPGDIAIERVLPTHWPHLLPAQDTVSLEPSENYVPFQPPIVPISEQAVDLSHLMPDAWPELEYIDTGDNDDAEIRQLSDPLKARQLPLRKSLAQYKEQEQEENVAKDVNALSSIVSLPVSPFTRSRRKVSVKLRIMYFAFAATIVLTLLVGSAFIAQNLTQRSQGKMPNSPFLTAIPSSVHPGQQVLLRLTHFSPSTDVYVTHDLQEIVQTDAGTALVKVGTTGSRDVHVLIDSSWGAGIHTLEAEDVTTHYTTTTTIQVLGTGPIKPTRLLVNQAQLDMGAGLQGANTIQPLELHNAGGGTISWVASSNQPWLQFTPTHGVFSSGEHISVAVTRADLTPGENYRGTITIISSTNTPLTVQITMKVLPLPTNPNVVLEVTPPALSFTTNDGGPDPSDQLLTIKNPGIHSLTWSFANMTTITTQNTSPMSDVAWLSTMPYTGVVAPGASTVIHARVSSQNLLPGIYNAILIFTSLHGGYDTPQQVATSLIISSNTSLSGTPVSQPSSTPSAGVGSTVTATSPPSSPVLAQLPSDISFSSTQGQSAPANQNVAITNTGGSALQWQASIPSSASSWLSASSLTGTVAAGQTGQMTLSVQSTQLEVGSYTTQVTVSATNSAGVQVQNSPQLLNVTLTIYAPCVLQVTPSTLSFTATLLNPNPAGQKVTLSETGNCVRPVSWKAVADHSWLNLSSTSGTDGSTITVYINASGMILGTYNARITLSAIDKNGASTQHSPQTVSVALTVIG